MRLGLSGLQIWIPAYARITARDVGGIFAPCRDILVVLPARMLVLRGAAASLRGAFNAMPYIKERSYPGQVLQSNTIFRSAHGGVVNSKIMGYPFDHIVS